MRWRQAASRLMCIPVIACFSGAQNGVWYKKNVRVGLFTESYDPIINGVSTSLKTLTAELIAAGHEPIVVAPHYSGFKDEVAPPRVIRLPSWRTIFNPENPFAFPPVGALPPPVLRNVTCDIVHTQQPFGMGHHGVMMARRLGIPLVSTFHTLYTEYSHYLPFIPQNTARWWLSDQMHRYYLLCDAVIVPSREAGRRLEAVGVPPEKLRIVPTGVAEAPMVLPQAIEQTRRTYSLPPETPVVLFVGRLAREKNLDLLVDAFARIVHETMDKDPQSRPVLLMVGSGPYLSDCQERVERAGITSFVRFTGFLKRNELAPVYAAATVFAFPSPTETQGVVLSEAQGHGLPCVVVEGGGAPEFVRPDVDALVVPPTPDAFHAALKSLLEDIARRRAFAAAALSSPLRPTPVEMVRRIVAIYDECRQPGKKGAADSSSRALPH